MLFGARRCPADSKWGGVNRMETDVRLAYKAVFVRFSTSGGRPMLLGPDASWPRCFSGARRCPADSKWGGVSRTKTDVRFKRGLNLSSKCAIF